MSCTEPERRSALPGQTSTPGWWSRGPCGPTFGGMSSKRRHRKSVDNALLTGAVRATGLTKSFGSRRVLAGVDISVAPGRSLAIMGRSGSGKSTLLHVLAGITRPDSGHVAFGSGDGELVASRFGDERRAALRLRHLGFVFQRGMLLPDLTAEENVALPCLLRGESKDAAITAASRALGSIGLQGYGSQRPGQLSGGEAQRVAIARAIVTDARIIFADEPTASLDESTAASVVDELVRASTGQGRTLIVVTHDPVVAARCDDIVRIVDGRIDAESLRA